MNEIVSMFFEAFKGMLWLMFLSTVIALTFSLLPSYLFFVVVLVVFIIYLLANYER